ncbi:vomeronasal secretory protein 2-like isoform X2 [Rattus norvegicus]|uniref:vomeronasal secretory protein 2-like isoform X2 n=1 Tax=Rattus norvegicus TaxID=10116 RepID=UPI001E245690
MKSLVLTVILFCLMPVLQAQDDLPFLSEDRNVSGTWYKKAIVYDVNSPELISMEEFPFVVRMLHKGSMEVTIYCVLNGECIRIDFLMEKTEKPGMYRAFWNSLLTYVYELPVMDHYVFYSELKLIEKKVYAGELIGKDPKENPQALEEFKKFIQSKGFPLENIIVPQQREMCVPEVSNAVPQDCKPRVNPVFNGS